MANLEHVELLLQGRDVWGEWRVKNINIIPLLNGPDIRDANIINSYLTNANLSKDDLDSAKLHYAFLSNTDLRSYFLYKVNLYNANLSHADLSHANLNCANLNYTNLNYANLSYANLINVDLSDANLSNADLTNATLSNSNLGNANLANANLFGADLSDVTFKESDLSYTDFSKAILSQTRLCNLDLSTVKGLESVKHLGPSTLGIDTYLKSQGKIPNEFLLGCGLTQDVIDHMRTLTMNPLEFNSCFISYSSKDEKFAQHLHANLRSNNVRVWYAPEDMKSGRKIYEQVDQAIQMHDKLLVILSKASMESDWVRTEITKAHARERKEKRQILFPIALVPFKQIKSWDFFDSDFGKSLSGEVRAYHIPDFSDWKNPAAFEKKFSKLLSDLKGGKNTPRGPLPKLKG